MKRLSLEALKGSSISNELTKKLTGGECAIYCHPPCVKDKPDLFDWEK